MHADFPSDVWALFVEWARKHMAEATVRNYERLVERWLATVIGIPVEDLKAFHLVKWGTTWHELQAVKRVWHWACEEAELLDRNPFKKVKLPPIGERTRILTRPEFASMLAGSSRDFRLYLLAMWHTLARPQEVRGMAWEQLRWPGYPEGLHGALAAGESFFVFREYKARMRRKNPNAPRLIAVPAPLGRILAARVIDERSPSGPVLLTDAGVPWTNDAVRRRMERLRDRLGFEPDAQGEDVVCYTIRHTGATSASAAGVRDRLLAEILGHTSTRTTARYQHLQADHLTQAMRFLASVRKNGRPGSSRTNDLDAT